MRIPVSPQQLLARQSEWTIWRHPSIFATSFSAMPCSLKSSSRQTGHWLSIQVIFVMVQLDEVSKISYNRVCIMVPKLIQDDAVFKSYRSRSVFLLLRQFTKMKIWNYGGTK